MFVDKKFDRSFDTHFQNSIILSRLNQKWPVRNKIVTLRKYTRAVRILDKTYETDQAKVIQARRIPFSFSFSLLWSNWKTSQTEKFRDIAVCIRNVSSFISQYERQLRQRSNITKETRGCTHKRMHTDYHQTQSYLLEGEYIEMQ